MTVTTNSSVGGPIPNPSLFPTTSYLTKCMLNNAGSGTSFAQAAVSGTGLTIQIQTALETDYTAIQVGVVNIDTAAVTVRGCALAWAAAQADNSAAANFNSSTWTDFTKTVNGVSAATMALDVMPAAISQQGTVTWFDVLPIASVTRSDSGKTLPGLSVRVEWITGANFTYLPGTFSSPAIYETDSAANGGRFWRTRGQSVAGGSNATKATLTATATWSFSPPVLIRYWPKSGKPRTLLILGDSISSASGGTASNVNLARYGWAEMLRTQYSTPANPIEIANCGLGGAGTATILAMARTVVPSMTNSMAVFPNGTPNGTSGTLSAADTAGWNGYKSNIRSILEASKVPNLVWTMLPVGAAVKAWGSSDSFRQGMNLDDVTSGQLEADFSSVLSGTISSGQYPLTNTDDNVHPTDTGNSLLVPALAAALKL